VFFQMVRAMLPRRILWAGFFLLVDSAVMGDVSSFELIITLPDPATLFFLVILPGGNARRHSSTTTAGAVSQAKPWPRHGAAGTDGR
jgi:hypothetical protein